MVGSFDFGAEIGAHLRTNPALILTLKQNLPTIKGKASNEKTIYTDVDPRKHYPTKNVKVSQQGRDFRLLHSNNNKAKMSRYIGGQASRETSLGDKAAKGETCLGDKAAAAAKSSPEGKS